MAIHTENVVINPRRMEYLLAYFAMSKDGLIDELNATRKRKKPYSKEEIFNADNELKISTLRRIDKIFERGLYFYTTHTNLEIDEKESILFRKREFNANLTHADRLMVRAAEEQNLYTQSIVELSEFECQRKLDKYSLEDNPYDTGVEIRKALGIEPHERKEDDTVAPRASVWNTTLTAWETRAFWLLSILTARGAGRVSSPWKGCLWMVVSPSGGSGMSTANCSRWSMS